METRIDFQGHVICVCNVSCCPRGLSMLSLLNTIAIDCIYHLILNKISFVFCRLFTGTTERVALITGTVEALNNVCAFIIEKVKESPQLAAKTGSESITPPERARQVFLPSLALSSYFKGVWSRFFSLILS